ncbi:hypothetical protein NDU88_000486 [Pleurodeles waltl]|uniref:Uncharacterized protein n=1 Tax=Pleurodeles waltl TaxID=8319 RepID=A0AAV7UQ43_PLEWA|nr:hypothetical protein NDU88_000486 [Pleurodeles waltl]
MGCGSEERLPARNQGRCIRAQPSSANGCELKRVAGSGAPPPATIGEALVVGPGRALGDPQGTWGPLLRPLVVRAPQRTDATPEKDAQCALCAAEEALGVQTGLDPYIKHWRWCSERRPLAGTDARSEGACYEVRRQ